MRIRCTIYTISYNNHEWKEHRAGRVAERERLLEEEGDEEEQEEQVLVEEEEEEGVSD